MARKKPNGEAPVLAIKLDKVRHLRADFNALAAAEEVTGLNMLDPKSWKNIKAKDFRGVLWALLLHEDPELTIEQVGAMLHGGNIATISEALGRAIEEGGATASPKPVG